MLLLPTLCTRERFISKARLLLARAINWSIRNIANYPEEGKDDFRTNRAVDHKPETMCATSGILINSGLSFQKYLDEIRHRIRVCLVVAT